MNQSKGWVSIVEMGSPQATMVNATSAGRRAMWDSRAEGKRTIVRFRPRGPTPTYPHRPALQRDETDPGNAPSRGRAREAGQRERRDPATVAGQGSGGEEHSQDHGVPGSEADSMIDMTHGAVDAPFYDSVVRRKH